MAFSQATLDFLFENRMRDSRDWFNAHRADYERLVLQPLRDLVVQLEPAVHAVDPLLICEPKVSRSISRIWRDTRFSKDKSTFRDVMWLSFQRRREPLGGLPGFYFEISPAGYSYGCGYYEAGRPMLELLRERALHGDKRFLAADRAYRAQSVFTLEGGRYKRTRYPDAPAALREWLDLRDICFVHEGRDPALLFSDALADEIARGYALLPPMYAFMMSCELDSRGVPAV